jgi:hypothetical protein
MREVTQRTALRFIAPLAVVFASIAVQDISVYLPLSAEVASTVTVSSTIIGMFSFVAIINHARNPIIDEQAYTKIIECLTSFGGLLIFIQHTQIMAEFVVLFSASIIFVSGTLIAVITDYVGLDSSDIILDSFRIMPEV